MGRPDWTLGYLDEVWWSRLAQPALHGWSSGQPLRLIEAEPDSRDRQPKALACYGVWLAGQGQMLLRFAAGRPLSAATCAFLEWVCRQLQARGKRVWALVWDNAAWHISRQVRQWLDRHNRQVKQARRGVRILVCHLPVKSPWLNPIEPKWLHGKRAVAEPNGILSAEELTRRVCRYYGCACLEPLAQQTP